MGRQTNKKYNRTNGFPSIPSAQETCSKLFSRKFVDFAVNFHQLHWFHGNLFWLTKTTFDNEFIHWVRNDGKHETMSGKLHMFKPSVERHEAMNVHLETFIRRYLFDGWRKTLTFTRWTEEVPHSLSHYPNQQKIDPRKLTIIILPSIVSPSQIQFVMNIK